jgi:hypothetical protein
MNTSGGRIPAWKRLGLKLKKENQSGNAAPEPNANEQVGSFANAPRGTQGGGKDVDSPAMTTEKGESSSLGKRKHQHDAAEEEVHTPKKSKNSKNGELSPPVAGADLTGPKETSTETTQRPKGDPNYRRKKEKKNNRRTSAYGQEQPPPAERRNSGVEARAPSPPVRRDADDSTSLLPSTEPYTHAPAVVTPKASKKSRNVDESTPPRTDRRKSVTFTPDTKTVDGNSASNLFKKWVAEQKGAKGDFSSSQTAQFTPPPKVHPANGLPAVEPAKSEALIKEVQKPKGKKKDPSLYIAYLTQYHNDYANWKFNKAKQNDVVDNALNVFRIPEAHSEALFSYIRGLKGAGVIERLKTRCYDTLKQLDEEDKKDPTAMEDIKAREAAKEEALEERVKKEKKRRQTNADIEDFHDHPNPDAFIRRLKRRRAEALLEALGMAAPLPPPTPKPAPAVAGQGRNPRKRKSRTEVSSDESSSEESSSEESSSEDSSSKDSSSEDSSAEDSSSEDSSSEDSSSEDSSSEDSSSDDTSSDESSDSNPSDPDSDESKGSSSSNGESDGNETEDSDGSDSSDSGEDSDSSESSKDGDSDNDNDSDGDSD